MPARSQGPNWSELNFLCWKLVPGGQRTPLDLSYGSSGGISGDPKWRRMNDFSLAKRDPLLADAHVDRLFVVNPCRNPRGSHAQPQRIPPAEFELAGECRFVHGSVRAIDTG